MTELPLAISLSTACDYREISKLISIPCAIKQSVLLMLDPRGNSSKVLYEVKNV